MVIELTDEYELLIKELTELRGTNAREELERAIDYYYFMVKLESQKNSPEDSD